MHYINRNEDVLVSLGKEIPDGFYEIPSLNSYWLAQVIINKSLFVASKCYCLSYKEVEKRDTQAMTNKLWMEQNGFNFDDCYYDHSLKNNEWCNYDMLKLACLYGGNFRSFRIINPFIIPRDYIVAKYDKGKIDSFIESLKVNGFIEINLQ